MNLDRIISVQNSITVYRDGDRCVKVFNPDCAKADVLNEALNQARMEQTTVTVPEIREVRQVNGKWAIVSEYIKGENLEQLIAKHPEKPENTWRFSRRCTAASISSPAPPSKSSRTNYSGASMTLRSAPPTATISIPGWSASPNITRSATATSSLPRSSSAPKRESPTSSIGSTPRRAMPPPMQP